MDNTIVTEWLNLINNIIGIIGFIISIISFLKINSVEKSLKRQKEGFLFKRKYKPFCQELDNVIVIMKKEGLERNYITIINLCDKITRFTGGMERQEQKELINHIRKVEKAYKANENNAAKIVERELNSIRNLLESVGEKNDI